ncbi:MAG: type II secretion system protein [Desulfuromonadales bacterium]|nr:type II secretion system protein [Desulfuromonadales bacterium]
MSTTGPRPCRRTDRCGFTLVEVMVALTIFLIASMGLLPLLVANMQADRNLSLYGQAQRLAGEAMAELQARDYQSLSDLDGSSLLSGPIEVRREIASDHGLTRLAVTAAWRQRDRQHSYRLESLRAAP